MPRNLPYNRADRVAKQVYQVVASYLYERVDDPRFTGIQLTNAQMTKDLSIARIYFFIGGGKDRQDKAKKALETLAPELRHNIGRELVLKMLPRIEFYADKGFENAERVEELLKSLKCPMTKSQ